MVKAHYITEAGVLDAKPGSPFDITPSAEWQHGSGQVTVTYNKRYNRYLITYSATENYGAAESVQG